MIEGWWNKLFLVRDFFIVGYVVVVDFWKKIVKFNMYLISKIFYKVFYFFLILYLFWFGNTFFVEVGNLYVIGCVFWDWYFLLSKIYFI